MEPTNPELFDQPDDKVLRLEFLPSPGLTFEEHFNTNFKLDLDRYGYFVEKYAGLTRVEGFEVQKSGSDINVTAGVIFHKQFILKEASLSTVATFSASNMKLILKITTLKKTQGTHPSDINIVIGTRTFSGPNQYTYSTSYLYTASAVPSDTSTEFHIYLADISSGGVVTQKIDLLADTRSWNFLKLTDTPDNYTGQTLKAVRVNAGETALEYFDAALASHTHDDRYFTEGEVTSALAGKSDTSHTHDDRYFTEGEVTSALAGKAAAVHTHDDRYYQIADVNSLLSAKAALAHSHIIGDVTGLQAALDAKSATGHVHTLITTTGFPTAYVANKWMKVNSGGTAVEFFTAIDKFTSLTDAPADFSASTQTGMKFVKVNAGGTALEVADPLIQVRVGGTDYNSYKVNIQSSDSTVSISPAIVAGDGTLGASLDLDLTVDNPITSMNAIPGFPESFTTAKGKLVRTNAAENGVEFGPVVHDLDPVEEGALLFYGKVGGVLGIKGSEKIKEIVGKTGMGFDLSGTSQIAGDWVFKNSTFGPVLQDRSNNNSYRITVNNGQIVLVKISTFVDAVAAISSNITNAV